MVEEKRAQLNMWVGSGEHCPRWLTSPTPLGLTEIAPSLPPAGPSVPLGTPTAGPGGSFQGGFLGQGLPFWALLWLRAKCAGQGGRGTGLLVPALWKTPCLRPPPTAQAPGLAPLGETTICR